MKIKIFKSKRFNRLTRKENIDDTDLIKAIEEIENGLVDADLGGHVYKKRIPRQGQGKSGGYRTIILFKKGRRAIFAYGFAKNNRANITKEEEENFKTLADTLLKLKDEEFEEFVGNGEYIKVEETQDEEIHHEEKAKKNGKKV